MTRLYNDPIDFKEEMLVGFVNAYSRYVKRVPNASGVMALEAPQAGKVSIVIGGGSGHYPAFCGYVGRGLADAAVMGEIFTSPSAEQVYRCTKAVAAGLGVLYIYGNYSGDVLNFDMAAARCLAEDIDVRSVQVTDDVASAPKSDEAERRGIAGDFFVFKVAGAAAARGDTLNEVERLTRYANAQTRSFGIAFDGCTLPGQPGPLFTVDPGRMELGLGVHGEPGYPFCRDAPGPRRGCATGGDRATGRAPTCRQPCRCAAQRSGQYPVRRDVCALSGHSFPSNRCRSPALQTARQRDGHLARHGRLFAEPDVAR